MGKLRRELRRLVLQAKRIPKFVFLEIRYGMLLGWHSIVGPPRLLVYDAKTNARLLRAFGASVSRENVKVLSPVTFHVVHSGYHNLTIGANVLLNGNNWLDLKDKITLEDGVSLGPGVIILTHNRFNRNDFLEERFSRLVGKGPVKIGAGTGIKANAVILHSTTIGREAVVAGGSIVSRHVPDRALVSGTPARIRRML